MSFRINRVYTRSGDDGETGLVGKLRVRKSHPRVATYGELDELNSQLGVVKEIAVELTPASKILPVLSDIQQQLFDLGSEMATDPSEHYEGMWRVTSRHVEQLESLCDTFGDGLEELSSFILPGGSKLAAELHVARSIARRVERSVVGFLDREPRAFGPEVVKYLNRMSDLLFILARWALKVEGKTAPLWIQEVKRSL